jgi:hypothetical protein
LTKKKIFLLRYLQYVGFSSSTRSLHHSEKKHPALFEAIIAFLDLHTDIYSRPESTGSITVDPDCKIK